MLGDFCAFYRLPSKCQRNGIKTWEMKFLKRPVLLLSNLKDAEGFLRRKMARMR